MPTSLRTTRMMALALCLSSCGVPVQQGTPTLSSYQSEGPSLHAAQLDALSLLDEKAMDAVPLAEVIAKFEAIVRYNESRSDDKRWKEIIETLEAHRSKLDQLAATYPTLGDLREGVKIANYKSLNVAPWQSDLDAFPISVVYPAREEFLPRSLAPMSASSPAPSTGCIGSIVVAAGGLILGTFGEILSLGMGGPFGKHYLVSVGGAMMVVGVAGAGATCR